MMRTRPRSTALSAALSLAVAAPATTLIEPASFVAPALLVVLVVALTGLILRAVPAPPAAVIAGQLLALLAALLGTHAPDSLWYGLPTPSTLSQVLDLVKEAGASFAQYSAPAPGGPGTDYVLSSLVGVVALALDAVAVTLRRPAPAGIIALTAYLGSATNSGAGLDLRWFLAPAALWLLLLADEGLGHVTGWGAAPPSPGSPAVSPATMLRRVAGGMGVAALVVAVVGAGSLPHLPTRFLADGLGRADDGVGAGGRTTSLASTADVARSLGDRSTTPVFRYTTTTSRPDVFRVEVLEVYSGGVWTSNEGRSPTGQAAALDPLLASDEVARTTHRIDVTDNRLAAPQVALPPEAVGSPFPEGALALSPLGVPRLLEPVRDFGVDFVTLAPTPEQLAFDPTRPAQSLRGDALLDVFDPRFDAAVTGALAEALDGDETPIEAARAIQAYLRGPTFSYSLSVATPNPGEDPIASFLRDRSGYCVQFATAMIAMAKRSGIPARMAVGFLSGSFDRGSYVVRGSDAHAWPELYFPEVGWIRFEPTPGGRAGPAPTYTLNRSDPLASPSASSTRSAAPTTRPTRDIDDTPASAAEPTLADRLGGAINRWWPAIATGVLFLLAVLTVPTLAWLRRRRRHSTAMTTADAVEQEWVDLLQGLRDRAVPAPPGATARQVGRHCAVVGALDAAQIERLGTVIAMVERYRYSAARDVESPEDTLAMDSAVDDIIRAIDSRATLRERVRARLLPGEGLAPIEKANQSR